MPATDAAPRAIAIVGGARRVGRSTVARHLAAAVAHAGRRVCVLDATSAAPSDAPGLSLRDVLAGRARLGDALVVDAAGVGQLRLGSSGRRGAPPLDESAILAHVDALEPRYDFLLIDVPSGTQPHAGFLAAAATDVLLVVTPEPGVLRLTEAFVRQMAARAGRHECLLLANACAAAADATAIAHRLAALAARPPHLRLQSLGWIPTEAALGAARRTGQVLAPDAPAARAFAAVADRLVHLAPARPTGGAQFFFQRLLAQGRAA